MGEYTDRDKVCDARHTSPDGYDRHRQVGQVTPARTVPPSVSAGDS